MSTLASIRREQGFEVFALRSDWLELAAIPELGAKVISLKNLVTGREWMYWPTGETRLFRNRPGDDFARSTLVGWDECLPTIAPCELNGRTLPDHGEVWSVAWEVDRAAWRRGALSTSVRLGVSPMQFRRTIELVGRVVRLRYELTNLSDRPQPYLWAMHPLFAIRQGDRLQLSDEIRGLLSSERWIDSLDFADREPACAKVFAGPLHEGRAGITNALSGDCLTFLWDVQENDTLGVWLTRGGWNGHHHLALEPTCGQPDSLAVAVEKRSCATISPGATRSWLVRIVVAP